jgi:hypothetical protein
MQGIGDVHVLVISLRSVVVKARKTLHTFPR